jgi:hypothetical protein
MVSVIAIMRREFAGEQSNIGNFLVWFFPAEISSDRRSLRTESGGNHPAVDFPPEELAELIERFGFGLFLGGRGSCRSRI